MLGSDLGELERPVRGLGLPLEWTTQDMSFVQKTKKLMRGPNRDGNTLPVCSCRAKKGYPKGESSQA